MRGKGALEKDSKRGVRPWEEPPGRGVLETRAGVADAGEGSREGQGRFLWLGLRPESQDGRTVMGSNGAKAGGTLDWAQGGHVGSPARTWSGCSGTFSYGGGTEGQGWKSRGGGMPDGG